MQIKIFQKIINFIRYPIYGFYKRIIMFIIYLLVYDNEKSNWQLRNLLYRTLGMKIGKKCYISRGLDLYSPKNLILEDYVCLGQSNIIQSFTKVKIGKYVQTARDVSIIAGTHDEHDFSSGKKDMTIEIGAGCWIGTRVTILAGVKIGKGCIIGAGAVVNKDIPDFSIAAGVPCKVIRKREPADIIIHPSKNYSLKDLMLLPSPINKKEDSNSEKKLL